MIGVTVRISTQKDDLGYDPECYLNEKLEIFCDNQKIATAHTADTDEGVVYFYERDAKGRMKTKEVRGKVEIHGM